MRQATTIIFMAALIMIGIAANVFAQYSEDGSDSGTQVADQSGNQPDQQQPTDNSQAYQGQGGGDAGGAGNDPAASSPVASTSDQQQPVEQHQETASGPTGSDVNAHTADSQSSGGAVDANQTQGAPTPPEVNSQGGEGKVIFVLLIAIVAVSVYLHMNGQMIIYKDYTDAALSLTGIVVPLAVAIVCAILGVPDKAARFIGWATFIAMGVMVFRLSYISNENVVYALLSFATKYITTCVYLIVMLYLLYSGPSKQKDETDLGYAIRSHRHSTQMKIAMAALTAFFAWFLHVTTRSKEWTPLDENISTSFKKLILSPQKLIR